MWSDEMKKKAEMCKITWTKLKITAIKMVKIVFQKTLIGSKFWYFLGKKMLCFRDFFCSRKILAFLGKNNWQDFGQNLNIFQRIQNLGIKCKIFQETPRSWQKTKIPSTGFSKLEICFNFTWRSSTCKCIRQNLSEIAFEAFMKGKNYKTPPGHHQDNFWPVTLIKFVSRKKLPFYMRSKPYWSLH